MSPRASTWRSPWSRRTWAGTSPSPSPAAWWSSCAGPAARRSSARSWPRRSRSGTRCARSSAGSPSTPTPTCRWPRSPSAPPSHRGSSPAPSAPRSASHPASTSTGPAWRRPAGCWRTPAPGSRRSPAPPATAPPRPCAAPSSARCRSHRRNTAGASTLSGADHADCRTALRGVHRARHGRTVRDPVAHPRRRGGLHRGRGRACAHRHGQPRADRRPPAGRGHRTRPARRARRPRHRAGARRHRRTRLAAGRRRHDDLDDVRVLRLAAAGRGGPAARAAGRLALDHPGAPAALRRRAEHGPGRLRRQVRHVRRRLGRHRPGPPAGRPPRRRRSGRGHPTGRGVRPRSPLRLRLRPHRTPHPARLPPRLQPRSPRLIIFPAEDRRFSGARGTARPAPMALRAKAARKGQDLRGAGGTPGEALGGGTARQATVQPQASHAPHSGNHPTSRPGPNPAPPGGGNTRAPRGERVTALREGAAAHTHRPPPVQRV
ncbi:hypothetical protein SBRY_50390 [Actinacidiphila bryophytorum]|uniref:Uncharacterized protein n=1 Tax=Actinacidiphila bryophytorum TaxID=1436133 RepID=A0A9W4H4Q5_9ACTN|nr:hypothetical protein SBRY_50390 [Actinacidiphila bryophytorum]